MIDGFKHTTEIGDLGIGDVFMHDGHLYMYIDCVGANVLPLGTGYCESWDEDTRVAPLPNAKVVIP